MLPSESLRCAALVLCPLKMEWTAAPTAKMAEEGGLAHHRNRNVDGERASCKFVESCVKGVVSWFLFSSFLPLENRRGNSHGFCLAAWCLSRCFRHQAKPCGLHMLHASARSSSHSVVVRNVSGCRRLTHVVAHPGAHVWRFPDPGITVAGRGECVWFTVIFIQHIGGGVRSNTSSVSLLVQSLGRGSSIDGRTSAFRRDQQSMSLEFPVTMKTS